MFVDVFEEIMDPIMMPMGDMMAKNTMDPMYVEILVCVVLSSIPMQKEMTNLWDATAENITHTSFFV